MLLRTSSTPTLTPLIKSKEMNLELGGSKSSLTSCHWHSTISVFSTCHETVNKDVSLLTGGEWNFGKDLVPWPKIGDVQSENNLQIISNRSAPSAKASTNEALNSNSSSSLHVIHETRSRHQRRWSRRMLLRRYSSLPHNLSACEHNIISDSQFASQNDVRKSLPEMEEYQWTSEREEDLEDSENLDGSTRQSTTTYQNKGHSLTEREECSKSSNFVGFCSDSKFDIQELYSPRSVLKLSPGALHNPRNVLSGPLGESDEHNSTPSRQWETSFVIDGECYTTISRAANGITVACNSRGCIPLNTSKTLGPMFIAGGLGVDSKVNSGTFHYDRSINFEDKFPKAEENYVKLLEANPGHPLLLRNYARFLFEVRQDYQKAEEYFERAILAGPADGELLAQYAKLIWQIHQDGTRAGSYFEQAVQAAPEDCYVLTAYASFLWESEDAEHDSQHSESSTAVQAASPIPV